MRRWLDALPFVGIALTAAVEAGAASWLLWVIAATFGAIGVWVLLKPPERTLRDRMFRVANRLQDCDPNAVHMPRLSPDEGDEDPRTLTVRFLTDAEHRRRFRRTRRMTRRWRRELDQVLGRLGPGARTGLLDYYYRNKAEAPKGKDLTSVAYELAHLARKMPRE